MTENKEVDNNFRIEQFKKFYDLLMSNAPVNYKPWFFPCERFGKNPDPLAILRINKDSKGSWHHESARLDKEEAIAHLNMGYNIGISAREGDALIVGDIDNPKLLNQMPNTLTTTSRKRCGGHFFGWDKDGSAKINIPTNDGELRSFNQYVLACGSYVSFDLKDEKELTAYNELTQEAKDDPLLGYYTLNNAISPKEIGYQDLPQIYKDKQDKDSEALMNYKQKEEHKEFRGEGKYSELFKLKVSDIVGLVPEKQRFGHPLHASDSDANFCVSKDGCLGHCWRHLVSLNAVQFLCVKAGYMECMDAGTPHKGTGFSKIKGDKKALEIAYQEALKLGLIKKYVPPQMDRNRIITLIATRQEDLATEEIAKHILKNHKIKSIKQDKSSEIWFYKEGVMKPNGESQIKEICRELFEETFTPQRVNKVVAKIEADTFIEADDFFRGEQENTDEIPVKNGILNVKTLQLADFTDTKIFFNKINATYNPGADCPNIKKFLSEIVKNQEDIDVIFEIIGSMLYKRYFPQIAVMLLGDGENGKGVLESLMRTLIGADNCSSIPLNQMTSDSFSVCEMFGKLANLSGDISNTDLKDTGRFKELSSGTDLISAKRKFLKELKFVNYAKLIFSCNELPRSYDLSHGFWRRWLILEFPYKFLKQKEYDLVLDKTNIKLADSELIFKLTTEEELNGLLNEALKGLHRLFNNKQYSSTQSTAEVKDFWIRKSDSFTAFCFDCIEEDINGWLTKKELRKMFNYYCKKHKVKGASDKNIKAVLEDMFGVTEGRKSNGIDYDRDMVWEGIKLKNLTGQGVNGFSSLSQISNLAIGSNTHGILAINSEVVN